jgi:tetratricopeptide (TPR) repeat protein
MKPPRLMPQTEFLSAAQGLLSRGDFDTAIRVAKERVLAEPGFGEARFLLAFALVRKGRFDDAIVQLEEVARAQPGRKEAVYGLAMALLGSDRKEAALERFEQFLKLDPRAGNALLEAANLAMRLGKPDKARRWATSLTQLAPNVPDGWFLLGSALALEDLMDASNQALAQALRLDPAQAKTRLALFTNFVQLDRNADAAEVMKEGVRREPENAEFRGLLGSALTSLGREEEAEAEYKKAAELDPRTVGSYSTFLQERGRFLEAQAVLENSLKESPQQGIAFYHLAEMRSFSLDGEPLAKRAEALLTEPDLALEDQMYLHYALFRAREVEKDFAGAMGALDAANRCADQVYNAGREYHVDEEEQQLLRRMERFPPELLRRKLQRAQGSNSPIFIVGMIRSGTTLLDQIVSSHSQVKSAGEQKFWGLSADRWAKEGADTSPRKLGELVDAYEKQLARYTEGDPRTTRVTDKMPLNYHHLGLIHLTFPNAKILHIRRDPLDTCLSIYSTFFGRGPKWAYRQSNIVANYRLYLRLMEHWRQALPADALLEVNYEDLVRTPETSVPTILEFCDLPWEDAVLHPEGNPDAIKTPSRWQARQPIHTGSVKRYERYLPYLGELKQLLG